MSSEVKVLCTVQGDPNPNIIWKKGDRIIQNSIKYTISSDLRTLTVKNFQSSDAGYFTCFVTNNAGVGEARLLLEVERSNNLELLAEPIDTESIAGATVEMPCAANTIKDITVCIANF